MKKNIILTFIILLYSVINVTTAQYQNIKFKSYQIEDGLPTNNLYKLLQDSKGYLWIGTANGLCRFDGYDFTLYQAHKIDSVYLAERLVYSLAESKDGRIWIGTLGGGLVSYSYYDDKFQNYAMSDTDSNSLPSNSIRTLYSDKEGHLWIGTNRGFCKYLPDKNEFKNYKVTSDSINGRNPNFISSFLDDGKGSLWVGTITGGLNKFSFSTEKIENIYFNFENDKNNHYNMIWDIEIDNDGVLWLASNRGLIKYEPDSNDYQLFEYPANNKFDPSDRIIRSIIIDSDNEIWIGSIANGLVHFNRDSNLFTFYEHDSFINTTVSSNYITDIIQGNNEQYWVATKGGGLNVFRKTNIEHLMRGQNIYSITKDADNYLWVGSNDALVKLDQDYSVVNKYNYNLGNTQSTRDYFVVSIIQHGNKFLLGTKSNGLNIFNDKKGTYEVVYYNDSVSKVYKSNRIKTIVKDSSGNFWFSNFLDGVTKYDVKSGNFKQYFETSGDTLNITKMKIECLLVSSDNILWIGTSQHGLIEFDIATDNFIHHQKKEDDPDSLSSNLITQLAESKDGSIWLGTYSDGLIQYDRINKKFVPINNTHQSKIIMGLLTDDKGDVWYSSNNGISRYNPRVNVFTNFTVVDGLQEKFFLSGSAFKDKDGLLYFGGVNGLNVINPTKINKQIAPPNLVISRFKVYDRRLPLSFQSNNLHHVYLDSDDNFISIEFSALDFRNVGNIRYKYKLDGVDKDWVDSGTRRYVSYTNLPGGEYRFKVSASHIQNNWSPQKATLIIFKETALWETTWFKILIPLLLIGFGVFLYRYRIEKLNKERNYLQNLVQEKTKLVDEVSSLNKNLGLEITERKKAETALISEKENAEKSDRLKSEFLAQMSHEIRSPINIILSYTSLLRDELREIKKDGSFDLHFSSIDSGGRRIIRTIDMILNMSEINTGTIEINPMKFDLNTEVLQNLHQEYIRYANGKKLQLNYFDKSENSWIYADLYSVTQMISNLIDNAIKYTKEGHVDITVHNNKEKIYLDIEDSGIGISKEYIPKLFNAFTQEESGYTRKFEGTGLGLALVKKYCELNKVKILVVSQKGKGSKFTLIFEAVENPNI